MIWPAVIGQERVKRQLIEAIQGGRLPHAYLFFGSEGVGKDAMAIELAKVLHCEHVTTSACGSCDSCLKALSLQHPDIKFVCALPRGKSENSSDPPLEKLTEQEIRVIQQQFKLKGENPYLRLAIPKANIIKINSIREIRRESTLTTFDQRRRMVIISRAEEMGEEAANMLLKTLEEPTGNTMFILTTSLPEALLSTIRSRCQAVRFDLLTPEQIEEALKARGLAESSQAQLVSWLALGSFTRALDLLDEDLAKERGEVLVFVKNVLTRNFPKLMVHLEELMRSRDRDDLVRFLTLVSIWFRDALVLREGGSIISVDQKDELIRFVRKFPDANLAQLLGEVERAISLLQRNVYIVLVLVQLSIQMKRNILPASQEREGRESTVSTPFV
jgi:DNA polymerase-3 subunit delta'